MRIALHTNWLLVGYLIIPFSSPIFQQILAVRAFLHFLLNLVLSLFTEPAIIYIQLLI